MADSVKKMIARTFEDIAKGLENGSFKRRPRIAVTGLGSEHGEQTVLNGAAAAAGEAEVFYIGTLSCGGVTTVKAESEEEAHKKMEELLDGGLVDGAVTMHFPFPIGVSTVGRSLTPALGKSMYIATTTGTSATDRTEGMIKNALYGVICAKACGNPDPSVGILNVESARQTEAALKELKEGGYPLRFGSSGRADGGCVLRGNDVLTGACDVLVTDPLTGNVLSKMLSSFNTGGGVEVSGSGYGPGIGKGYERLVMIVSRASGAPVIEGAVRYAAELIKGGYREIAAAEFAAAEKAGLTSILDKYKAKPRSSPGEAAPAPAKEVVTAQIAGIEITELDEAVAMLWQKGIYAESGMGCTGPIVLVAEKNLASAKEILRQAGKIQ